MAPGLTIGYHRSLPGGWGERLIAHESQLYPLPDQLPDRTAVLIEPLSIGVHAVLNCPPKEGEPALVIGSGPIALATGGRSGRQVSRERWWPRPSATTRLSQPGR